MSLTKVTYSMIEGATLNVVDFGAVGDGIADDTPAIQAAIDSRTNGYAVYFPAGTYKFTEALIRDKTNLTFLGPGILNGQFTVHNLVNDNDIQSNIVFDGLSFNRGRPDAGTTTAIKLIKVSAVKISGCFFKGVTKCIVFEGVSGVTQSIQRVSITDCSTGIADASLYSNAEKLSPYVYQTKGFPYYFYYNMSLGGVFGAGDITITGCNPCFVSVSHIYTVGQDGLVLTGNTFFSTSYSYRSPIKECVIYAENAVFLNITNNEVFEAGYEGIYLNGVANAVVVGNNIIWPGQRDAARGAGINLVSFSGEPVTSSTITGNIIRIPTSDGIRIGNDCQFVNCSSNVIVTPGNTATFYYGPTPVPTAYGIRIQPSGWQNTFVNNITMLAYNSIPKSVSTTYGAAELAGPIQSGNIDTAGNSFATDTYLVNTITSNTINIAGWMRVRVNTAGGTVSTIAGGNNGQTLVLFVESVGITLQSSATLKLGTASSIAVPVGGSVTLQLVGSIWYLLSTAL